MRTTAHGRRAMFAIHADTSAAARAPDAIAAHASSVQRHALQFARAANCKPRIERSSTGPTSIAS
ncbi:hypothetical protein DIE12_03975 [Burkholderia sp. Bp9015]|nr:hypothetical protein DIE20_02570 [Burkholderia sp. Bp9131]RQR78814.1 hypothetical protein DIE12_03975 [Burkholderia sp. Bp9015]RQS30060.1 hypothetical protein DIE05_11660 [Burkholderia sp. Bp8995]RQS46250.1 hypothetical protein DIE01_00755 [Burkholderia sp. Bp8990]RQS48223.1 hypothetical protein DIE00_12240 [Burkholderia sp. Bp8989]RQS63241.1 hypothetical protein DID98_05035 [Burkholderia sp. Bp8984]RQZ51597.1 hypothetical protein DIE17_02735 [Burkholderia sp. Bp9099]